MEENRLKEMRQDYDPKIFKDLYQKTNLLRKKLTSEIDHRRFGVDYNEVLSWFDVKFIYVFNKYYDVHTPEVLLGFIINALKTFKFRILRAAYTKKFSQAIVSESDVLEFEDLQTENPFDIPYRDELLEKALTYLKDKISDNAMMLLELKLAPPPYIQKKAQEMGIENFTRIPNAIFADYLALGTSKEAIKLVEIYQKEINYGISSAKEYFSLS